MRQRGVSWVLLLLLIGAGWSGVLMPNLLSARGGPRACPMAPSAPMAAMETGAMCAMTGMPMRAGQHMSCCRCQIRSTAQAVSPVFAGLFPPTAIFRLEQPWAVTPVNLSRRPDPLTGFVPTVDHPPTVSPFSV